MKMLQQTAGMLTGRLPPSWDARFASNLSELWLFLIGGASLQGQRLGCTALSPGVLRSASSAVLPPRASSTCFPLVRFSHAVSTTHVQARWKVPSSSVQLCTVIGFDDLLDWFRNEVDKAGGGNYQTLINLALRDFVSRNREPLESTLRRVIREELKRAG
jgi:uncharacterized protein (DUF4415 family)